MKIKRFIADSLWLIPLLLVFSTVFIVNRELANGLISGKLFWFNISIGAISATSLILALSSKLHLNFTKLDFLILLFVGSILFSSLVINYASQNTTKLTLLVLLIVLYFIFRLFIQNVRITILKIVITFIIITGLVEAIWGIRQLYGFIPPQHLLYKTTGSFFNPGPYAGYLAVVFPLALYCWITAKYKKVKDGIFSHSSILIFNSYLFAISSFFACITTLLVLPATMSRASWIAVIAGGLFVLTTHYSIHIRNYFYLYQKKMIFGVIVSCALLLAIFSGMYFLKKDSADGRLFMWKIALIAAIEHPLGVGLGNFPGAYGKAQAAYFEANNGSETEKYVAGNPEYGFNEYLQIAVESGVISLFLFIIIVVLSLRSFIIGRQWGIAGSMISLLIFAFFSYPFSILPFLIVFVFLLAISGGGNTPMTQIGKLHADKKYSICMSIVCVIITSGYLWKQYPVYEAYKKWNTDKFYYGVGLYKDAVNNYKELYPLLNDEIKFLFEYAQSLSKTKKYAESNKILNRAMQISCDPMLFNIMGKNYQAMKQYAEAERCFIKSSHIVPNRIYPYYLMALMYMDAGETEKAIAAAQIILTKEPKVQSTAVMEMREEARKIIK